jgi:hypothetical protein
MPAIQGRFERGFAAWIALEKDLGRFAAPFDCAQGRLSIRALIRGMRVWVCAFPPFRQERERMEQAAI